MGSNKGQCDSELMMSNKMQVHILAEEGWDESLTCNLMRVCVCVCVNDFSATQSVGTLTAVFQT